MTSPADAPPSPAAAPARPDAAPDYSLRRYLLEGVEAVTNADSRLARSFRALVGRPGELTRAYFSAGERETYLRPLQLFLLCNVWYFFVQPLTGWNTLTSPLRVHLNDLPYSPLVRGMVAAEIRTRGVAEAAYAARFDATTFANAKTLVIVMVPMFAAVLALLFARRRRFFVEHLVFATHLVAWLVLTLPLLLLVIPPLARATVWLGLSEDAARLLFDVLSMPVYCGAYAYFALRRAYGSAPLPGALRAVCVGLALVFVIQAYRAVLFFTTFWTV